MKSVMIAGAMIAALAASASVANAGEWRSGYYQHYRQGDVTQPRRGAYAWNFRQCWTDDGYGRFSPCDARR